MERKTGSSGWIVLMCAAIATAITGCAIHYTDVSGTERNRRVVDKATGVGVPEAFVVFQWDQDRDSFAHSTTTCARLAVLKTGAEGRYTVPDWFGRVPLVNRVYKRGYVSARDDVAFNQGVDYIARSGKTGADRIEEINNYLIRCGDGEERKLLEYYRALYDEFRAELPRGKSMRIEEEYTYSVDLAQFGRDEAERRLQERLRVRKGGQ